MNSIFTYIADFMKSKWAAITHGAASSVLTVSLILSGVPHWISAAIVVAVNALMHWAHFDGTAAVTAPVTPATPASAGAAAPATAVAASEPAPAAPQVLPGK